MDDWVFTMKWQRAGKWIMAERLPGQQIPCIWNCSNISLWPGCISCWTVQTLRYFEHFSSFSCDFLHFVAVDIIFACMRASKARAKLLCPSRCPTHTPIRPLALKVFSSCPFICLVFALVAFLFSCLVGQLVLRYRSGSCSGSSSGCSSGSGSTEVDFAAR